MLIENTSPKIHLPMIANRTVHYFFSKRLYGIPDFDVWPLDVQDIIDLEEFRPKKPCLLIEDIIVRRNSDGYNFKVKMQLKFLLSFPIEACCDNTDEEYHLYQSFHAVQEQPEPPEVMQAIRRAVGLRKGQEKKVQQFLSMEKRLLREPCDKNPDALIILEKTVEIPEFNPYDYTSRMVRF